MIGQRDPKFFSELKQLNEDLVNYLRLCHEKSPFFNFTPSINDYIKQFADLDKQYPLGGGGGANNSIKSGGSGPSPPKKTLSSSSTQNNSMSAFASAAPFVPSFAPQLSAATTTTTSSSLSAAPSQASLSSSATTTLPSQPPTMQPFLFGAPAPTPTSGLSQTIGGLSGSTGTTQTFFSFTLPPKRDEDNKDTSNSLVSGGAGVAADGNNAAEDEDTPPEPKIDKYEEPNAKHSAKCKLYEKAKVAGVGGEVNVNLLGVGVVYVKALDTPSKLQVIVRQEPDFRRVLLNEVISSNIPVKLLPKAVQILVPGPDDEIKHHIIKVRDEAEASTLYEMLNLAKS